MPTFRQDEKLGTKVPLIKTADFNDKSVTTEKLAEGSVTNSKLAPESVTQDKFDKELLQIFEAAAGLPEKLIETIQNVDRTLVDHQRQISSNDDDISDLQTKTKQIKDTVDGIAVSGGASVGSAVTYDNTQSGLDAQNIQNAIDELVNNLGHYETNNEWLRVYTDAENKFLWGIRVDGCIDWAVGIPRPIRKKIEELIATDTAIQESVTQLRTELTGSLNNKIQSLKDNEIKNLQDTKVDKEEGKSLIEDEVKECFRVIENEEFLKAIVDSDDKVLFGIYRATGKPYFPLNEMYHVEQNEEFFAVWLDASNHVLLGIRRDGQIIGEIHVVNSLKQVTHSLREKVDTINASLQELLDIFSMQENPEYLAVEKDADGRILSATYNDGSHYVHDLKSETFDTKVNKEVGKTLINEDVANSKKSFEDQEERMELITDSDDKILGYREKDGTKVEKKMRVASLHVEDGNDFIKYLKGKGYNINACDMSNDDYIRIPNQPRKAIVNISGVSNMPTSKTQNLHAWIEVWTLEGIYFKKRVILNAQGRSSLYLAKKNFAVDICNDEWIGDDTCKVKIGNWVSQDSFHFKAYYTDAFRGAGVVCYKLFDEISKSRGLHNDRAYKRYYKDSTSASYGINQNAEIAYDFGDEARTFPDGFPCIVYFKGEFLGVFSWQLKKHRDNMKMSKNKAENIHLDGFIRQNLFSANGTLPNTAWNPMSEYGFEIRNPKSLICMDGSKYDADKNKVQELIDDTSESYDASNKNMKLSFQVKKYIIALSKYDTELTEVEAQIEAGSKTKDDIKNEIDNRYDVDGIIDYLCFSNVIANYDGFGKNWQIASWNGVRFGVYPYDLDGVFGDFFDGTFSFSPKDNFMEPIS